MKQAGLKIWLLGLTLWLVLGRAGHASVTLESRVDTTTMRIGDVVTYSVIVVRGESTEVELPSLGANLGGFEIRDFNIRKPRKAGDKIIERVDYKISTFDVGEFVIPPVAVRYRAKGDTLWHELQSQPIRIHVASLNPDESGDIRDIKPPLLIPFDWMRVVRIGLLVLLAALAAAVGFVFVRKRRRGESLFRVRHEPPRPPHEVALEELDRLYYSDLLDRGEVKVFHFRISEIVRRYIEGRFGIPASDMTSAEILEAMRDGSLSDQERETLREFLEGCDLVKFAKYQPGPEEVQATIDRAYHFVRSTRPVVPESELTDSHSRPESEEEAVTSADHSFEAAQEAGGKE